MLELPLLSTVTSQTSVDETYPLGGVDSLKVYVPGGISSIYADCPAAVVTSKTLLASFLFVNLNTAPASLFPVLSVLSICILPTTSNSLVF